MYLTSMEMKQIPVPEQSKINPSYSLLNNYRQHLIMDNLFLSFLIISITLTRLPRSGTNPRLRKTDI